MSTVITLPNILTVLRLPLAILYVMLSINLPIIYINNLIFIAILLLSGVLDILDGYFARKLNLVTEFGGVLDAVFDKIFQMSVFIAFSVRSFNLISIVMIFVLCELILLICAWIFLAGDKVLKKYFMSDRFGKFVSVLFYFGVVFVLLFNIGYFTILSIISLFSCIRAIYYGRRYYYKVKK